MANGPGADGKVFSWWRVSGAALSVIIAAAVIATGAHLNNHDTPVRDAKEELRYEFDQKLIRLADLVTLGQKEFNEHKAQQGIHQPPDVKQNAMFKTATEVVDQKIGELSKQIGDLRSELRSYITSERTSILERLLKLETQQATMLEALNELKKDLKTHDNRP